MHGTLASFHCTHRQVVSWAARQSSSWQTGLKAIGGAEGRRQLRLVHNAPVQPFDPFENVQKKRVEVEATSPWRRIYAAEDDRVEIKSFASWQPLPIYAPSTASTKEAAEFFSGLRKSLEEKSESRREVFNRILNSQYFQQCLKAGHLGPSELSILSGAFEYVTLEFDETNALVTKNIWTWHAVSLLEQYYVKGIRLLPETWATFVTHTSRHLYKRTFRNKADNKFLQARNLYRNTREVGRLIEIWRLYFLSYGAMEIALEDKEGEFDSSDGQQQFFASMTDWQYGQEPAMDQRIFWGALMTSAVLFDSLSKLTSGWMLHLDSEYSGSRSTGLLNFSLFAYSELSFVWRMASAVRETVPNRMILRLGLQRMSIPVQETTALIDHINSLREHEGSIRQQASAYRYHAMKGSNFPTNGLIATIFEQFSNWIETAPEAPLAEMYFAFSGNQIQPLRASKFPLLEKMSLRLFQIENKLSKRIWTGFALGEGSIGEPGTSERSSILSAIILRTQYYAINVARWRKVKMFEDAWQRLDLSKSRIPNALWWLRFRLLWRKKLYRRALEAYQVALFDVSNRVPREQRSAAILRLTNRMLRLVVGYGNMEHAVYFMRSLVARKIDFNAETYRWLIRLYIKLGRLSSLPKLLRGYRARGGKGDKLGKESQMVFARLVRKWPLSSPTADVAAIYSAIGNALQLKDPTSVKERETAETTLQDPLSALIDSLEEKSTSESKTSLQRWRWLIESHLQLAKVIEERDVPNKAKLLVTLHEHLYVHVPVSKLLHHLKLRVWKLDEVVIRQFKRASPSEQLLLASGRLYKSAAKGFLSDEGAAKTNFRIMNKTLTAEFVCSRLEDAGLEKYSKILKDMRWPFPEAALGEKKILKRQRMAIVNVLRSLQLQAIKMDSVSAQTTPVRIIPHTLAPRFRPTKMQQASLRPDRRPSRKIPRPSRKRGITSLKGRERESEESASSKGCSQRSEFAFARAEETAGGRPLRCEARSSRPSSLVSGASSITSPVASPTPAPTTTSPYTDFHH